MSNVLSNFCSRGREKSGLELRLMDTPQQVENAFASLRNSVPAEYYNNNASLIALVNVSRKFDRTVSTGNS
jgi:hypothetical protein